ncbi:hypothetical protein GF336_04340 [Candidatus Woesearchaeota archaeon]|nr:hypothetical protein [Candidatus Woesearchaeota archaeon]
MRREALEISRSIKEFIDSANNIISEARQELAESREISAFLKGKTGQMLEKTIHVLETYDDFLKAAGFKKTIKKIKKALIKCSILAERLDKSNFHKFKAWMEIVENLSREINSILTTLIGSRSLSHGWVLDQLRREENFLLILHRLGSSRRKNKGIERDVDIANNIARTVQLHQKSFLRTFQISMDSDMFWIEHKGRASIYFGHPSTARHLLKVRKAKQVMALRNKSGVALPENVFKRMDPELHISIELKFGIGDSWKAVKTLIDTLNDYGLLQRVTFQSQNLYLLDLVKSYSRKLPTFLFSKGRSLMRFHLPIHFSWNEMFNKPAHLSLSCLPGYVDGMMEHNPPKDIIRYKAYADSFKKQGKLCMPFIINAFMRTQHGKTARNRIMQAYLAGCHGGFVEKSSVEPLIDLIKD